MSGATSALILLVLCVTGCSRNTPAADGGQNDAEPAVDGDTTELVDAKSDGDLDQELSDSDVEPSDAALDAPLFLELQGSDGGVNSGEMVATYDHVRWWDEPADIITYGLFSPNAFATFPDDRSFEFVNSDDLIAMTDEPLSAGVTRYRTFLRQRGIALEASPLDGVALVLTGHDGYHLEENGYGDFALDFVITDGDGRRNTGEGSLNEDYLIWDAEVYLPIDGYVVDVVRDAPDNEPGVYPDDAVNNMVGLHLQGAFYLYLLHFRQVAETVTAGATLFRGTSLGRVGNSGVSLEPHLHVVLLWYDERESRSWSVPFELARIYLADSPQGPASFQEFARPEGGTWASSVGF
jgi:hypothetical protein